MSEILERLKLLRVIPVVTIERAEDMAPVADTLVEGGLPCVEITFRTPAAADAIRTISDRTDILIGAGTVLSIHQVKTAMDAGARFIASPGFNLNVAGYCMKNNIVHTPGVCTPTEIEAALDAGLYVLKFFPAEACGGLDMLKAVSGPYKAVEFIPTGGINARNLARYLQFSRVLACGGSWIASQAMIRDGRFGDILKNTRDAVKIVEQCSDTASPVNQKSK